jgi:hypothetical protein
MYNNDAIDRIITAVKASSEFKTVLWGIELPQSTAAAQYASKTLPACFLWGGTSELRDDNETNAVYEKQTMNAYIIFFDSSKEQSTGIKELNRLERVFIGILNDANNDYSLNINSEKMIDRDTTFIKMGQPWNYLPPFYASRIEFSVESYIN